MLSTDRLSLRRVLVWTTIPALLCILLVLLLSWATSPIGGYYYGLYGGDVCQVRDFGLVGVTSRPIYPSTFPPSEVESTNPLFTYVTRHGLERRGGRLHLVSVVQNGSMRSRTEVELLPDETGNLLAVRLNFSGFFGDESQELAPQLMLLRLPDEATARLLRDVQMQAPSDVLVARAARLAKNHPHEPLLAMIQLDLLIALEQADAAEAILTATEEQMFADARPIVHDAPIVYRRSIQALRASPDMPRVASLGVSGNTPVPLTSIDQLAPAPWPGLVLVPAMQTNGAPVTQQRNMARVARVRAEMLALAGYRAEAVTHLRHHLVVQLATARDTPGMFSDMISFAGRQALTEGLINVMVLGEGTEEELRSDWEVLEQLRPEVFSADTHFGGPGSHLPGYAGGKRKIADPRSDVRLTERRSDALFQLLSAGVALRHHRAATGTFPGTLSEAALLRGDEHSMRDPFGLGSLRYELPLGEYAEARVWSLGPDEDDDHGQVAYDPTNGSLSDGDLIQRVPFVPLYPATTDPADYATRDRFATRFREGLPLDPYASRTPMGYLILDTRPVTIMSWGPGGEDIAFVSRMLPNGTMTRTVVAAEFLPIETFQQVPQGALLGWSPANGWVHREGRELEPMYDPTNGVNSVGDLWWQFGVDTADE